MRSRGTFARLALTGAAATGAVLMLAAGPAAAATSGSITMTDSSGQKIASQATLSYNTVLTVKGNVPGGSSQTNLVVTAPDGSNHTVASTGGLTLSSTTLTYHLDTTCLQYTSSSSCGGAPAPDGTYTFALTGGSVAAADVHVEVPPAQVQGLHASASGSQVTLSWQPGAEPDLVSYDVLTGSDQPLLSGIDPGSACSSSTCAVVYDMGAQATGTQTFVVRSERSTCPGCSSTLQSPDSQPASVTFPSPSPSAQPGSGGATGGGGTTGGSSSGTVNPTVHAAAPPPSHLGGAPVPYGYNYPIGPQVFAAAPGPLPPGGSADALGPSTGGYSPVLAYPGQGLTAQSGGQPSLHANRTAQQLTRVAPDTTTLWKSLAGCLLLVLAGGHVRAWLTRPRPY